MRRISYRPYLLLAAVFFCLMSFPKTASEGVRSCVIASIAPGWSGLHGLKEGVVHLLAVPFSEGEGRGHKNAGEFDRILQENQMLKSQMANVRDWLVFEDRIQEQLDRLKALSMENGADPSLKDFFTRRCRELSQVLELQIQSVPASVIFREPISWSSSIWLNVGEQTNQKLGRKIVSKNSPVLVGTSVIGVIEYVGAKQSRVRLITDSRLVPSVRALRGQEQNRHLLEHLHALLFSLESREDLLEDKGEILKSLHFLKNKLSQAAQESYLAKGELRGAGLPLWRSRGQVLLGVGFNYDFADREGPARDLRSGKAYSAIGDGEQKSILKAGDLLVTTGLDGVFPPGLRIALVSKVQKLKEGASFYELEAVPTAGDLNEINHVFVLPALEFQNGAS